MATKQTPNPDLLTWSPTALLAAVRNVLPHLINPDGGDGQAESVRGVLAKFDVLELHLGRYEKFIEILQATTWFEGIHPDQDLIPVSPLDQWKNKLIEAYNDVHITDDERSKMLVGINSLDTVEKVETSLGKVNEAIRKRRLAANEALAGAHDIPGAQQPVVKVLESGGFVTQGLNPEADANYAAAQAAKTPQQIRDEKQADQYGDGAQPGAESEAEKPAKKPRAKKAAPEPVAPAVDVNDPDNLAATGQEGKMIDENCGLGGTNLYANLDQKKLLLKLCQDPKITANERSKIYLSINKISYAEADRSITKMRGWIKDRPAPVTARPPVPPATDPAPVGSVAPAYDPDKMPFQQD
jgi:hypothetical protein